MRSNIVRLQPIDGPCELIADLKLDPHEARQLRKALRYYCGNYVMTFDMQCRTPGFRRVWDALMMATARAEIRAAESVTLEGDAP